MQRSKKPFKWSVQCQRNELIDVVNGHSGSKELAEKKVKELIDRAQANGWIVIHHKIKEN